MEGSEALSDGQAEAVSRKGGSEEAGRKCPIQDVSPNACSAAEKRRRHHSAKKIQTLWLKRGEKRGNDPKDQQERTNETKSQAERKAETLPEDIQHEDDLTFAGERRGLSVDEVLLSQLYKQSRKEAERRLEASETTAAPHERYEELMKIRRRLIKLQKLNTQSSYKTKKQKQELVSLVSQCETLSTSIRNSSLDKALTPDYHRPIAPELCLKQKLQRLLQVAVTKGVDLKTAFKHFDRDGNGTISRTEMHKGIRELGEQFRDLSPAEIDLLLDRFDLDEHGEVDYQAFLDFVMTKRYNDIERKLAEILVEVDVACLRESIKTADKDSNGNLSIAQFKEALGDLLSAGECQRAFEYFAHDSDQMSVKRFESFVQALHAAQRSASYHGLLSGITLTDDSEVAAKAQAAHEEMLQTSREGGKWWEVQCNNKLYDIRKVRPRPPWMDKSCLSEECSIASDVSDSEASIVWTTFAARNKYDPQEILNQQRKGTAKERVKLYFEAIERETQRLIDRVKSRSHQQQLSPP